MNSLAETTEVPVWYRAGRVRALFDAMATTYGVGGWLSGGQLARWRHQLAQSLPVPAHGPAHVVDLMAGGADLWPALRRRFGEDLHLDAVDFSAPMLARAAVWGANPRLVLYEANALATPLPAGQATAVTCAFGLKTLRPTDYVALATEAARLVRPGGEVALIEFVLPGSGWRRQLMQRYLALVMPVLGWLQPAAAVHAELLRYASAGLELPRLRLALEQAGFGRVKQRRLGLGYAVLITGRYQPDSGAL